MELEFCYLSAADTDCASAGITLESLEIFIISFWQALIRHPIWRNIVYDYFCRHHDVGMCKIDCFNYPNAVSKQAEDMSLDQSEHGALRTIRDLELYRNEFKGQLSHLYHDRK